MKHTHTIDILALLVATIALAVGGWKLSENQHRLVRIERMTDVLAEAMTPAPNDAFLAWFDPWLEQWLQQHNIEGQKPIAIRRVLTEHLIRYSAVSTHENIVQQSRVNAENAWALSELSPLLGDELAQNILVDAHNMWGRQFQGLETDLP